MKSLTGFNGSSINGSFASGSPIYASDLNQLAGGIDQTRTMPSNDVQFMNNTGGTAYSLGQQVYYNTAASVPWQPRDKGNGKFAIYPATINSIIPCIYIKGKIHLLTSQSDDPPPEANYVWNEDGECYIYLKAGPSGDAESIIWPSSDFTTDQYPIINGYDAPQNDSDAFGHILLALAQKDPDDESEFPPVTFTQFIFNSLWSERHKYSQPDSAFYYFYRV